jgi:hypothetical protein
MYPSCLNITDSHELSICEAAKQLNETEPEPVFDENLERIVSMTVFVLFGIIFVVGLIGNALVVIGEWRRLLYSLSDILSRRRAGN